MQILVRRTKRLWTDEEKRSICFQTAAPGVTVAQVAQRYEVNENIVLKWLRDPGFEDLQRSGTIREVACAPTSTTAT